MLWLELPLLDDKTTVKVDTPTPLWKRSMKPIFPELFHGGSQDERQATVILTMTKQVTSTRVIRYRQPFRHLYIQTTKCKQHSVISDDTDIDSHVYKPMMCTDISSVRCTYSHMYKPMMYTRHHHRSLLCSLFCYSRFSSA